MTRTLGAVCLLLMGCEAERTRIVLVLPAGTAAQVSDIAIETHPVNAGECAALEDFDEEDCMVGACRPGGFSPSSQARDRVSIAPAADGSLGPTQLALGRDDDPRDVIVIAELDTGARLYGCAAVEPGAGERTIELWLPLCTATSTCAEQFDPACGGQPLCVGGRFTDPANPPCVATATTVRDWLDAFGDVCGAPLPPISGLAEGETVGACRPAVLDCSVAPGSFTTLGVCPDEAATEPCVDAMNSYQPSMDFDCNNGHPGCGNPTCATPGEVEPCFGGDCQGERVCGDDLLWRECIFSREDCDGADNDCDGEVDEFNGGCTAGDPPVADRCGGRGCQCGDGDRCEGLNQACCDAGCVNIATSREHCGGCGDACPENELCVAGRCAGAFDVPVDADAGLSDAGVDCVRDVQCRGYADRTDGCAGGACGCGGGPLCDVGSTCCRGECVQIVQDGQDVRHCGQCGCICRTCSGGRCLSDCAFP